MYDEKIYVNGHTLCGQINERYRPMLEKGKGIYLTSRSLCNIHQTFQIFLQYCFMLLATHREFTAGRRMYMSAL